MKVSELFVKCLENEGVEYIFGVPGEENEDLMFALAKSDIRFVPCRHEQGAAFIANMIGRLTGKAGVCLSTLGPGATNLMTGVADANLDKAPVVAITGQGGQERLHHESHQLLDVVHLFEAITKWNTSIKTPETVTEVVRKAFKVAQLEKPGATHIELSESIADAPVDQHLQPLRPHPVRFPAPDASAVEHAVELIATAERPLILAGNGAIRNRASNELRQLVTATDIPVAATFMGKGAVSDRMDQSLMAIGLGFKDYVMEAFQSADCVICVGYDIAEYSPSAWNPDCDKTILHLDFEPAEVYNHYTPEVELICDLAGSIRAIQNGLSERDYRCNGDWYAPIRQSILDDLETYPLMRNGKFTVPGVLREVRSVLADDGLVISDVGAHKMWIARNLPTYVPNGCIISNGLASMGIAVPGGIGASIVDDQRQIVAMCGDGGFMMNCQELETAHRLGTGYVIVIFNDNDYGLISWKQERSRNDSVYTELGNPDFKAFAESFGINGYRPESESELRETLQRVIPNRELAVVEIRIDTSVNNDLTDKLKEYYDQ